jgi:hypothetical protein
MSRCGADWFMVLLIARWPTFSCFTVVRVGNNVRMGAASNNRASMTSPSPDVNIEIVGAGFAGMNVRTWHTMATETPSLCSVTNRLT